MNRIPQKHKLVVTEDGSETLFSSEYNENCHSTAGAKTETLLHYVNGCLIPQKAKQLKTISVLEVGFGTGLGFVETLATCVKADCFLSFASFEIDSDLIEYSLRKLEYNFTKEADYYLIKDTSFELKVYFGNARESIKKIHHHYQAIYQDAFSPKKNAILWTKEWFAELLRCADTDCVLSTYSSSSSIRKALIAAGWKVYPGERFGPKRSSTRARVSGETDPAILQQLDRSPAIQLTDENYKDYTL